MYRIKNNTIGKVVLGDLNVVIGFNAELDLESRVSREEIKKSKNLKKALDNNILILLEDTEENKASKDLEELEKRLKESILNELNRSQTGDNSDINQKFDLILQAIKSNNVTASNDQNVKKDIVYEDEEDAKKMLEMHKKSIERISKNSSGSIQSSQSKVNSSDLDDKTSELEGLL